MLNYKIQMTAADGPPAVKHMATDLALIIQCFKATIKHHKNDNVCFYLDEYKDRTFSRTLAVHSVHNGLDIHAKTLQEEFDK